MIPTLIGISLVCFILIQLIPGGPVEEMISRVQEASAMKGGADATKALSPEQIAQTAKEFKVFYAKVPGKAEGSYTMDHTAGSYVFDPSGKLRLFVRYGGGAESLAADIKALLAAG